MKKIHFNIKVTISDKKCPKHGCNLVSYGNLDPFCPKCQQEKTEREKVELVKKAQRDEVHNFLYQNSLIGHKEMWQCSFDNFKYQQGSQLQAYRWRAVNIAKAYLDPSKKFNTIFFGKSGTGKTHLAISILQYVNNHSSQRCLFLSVPRLLQANRDWQADHTSSSWSQMFTQQQVQKANLVVIDDLGAESATGDASNFVQSVIFSIYDSNQRIITTTNLSSSKIRSTYDNRILSRVEAGAVGHVMDFSKLTDHRIRAI